MHIFTQLAYLSHLSVSVDQLKLSDTSFLIVNFILSPDLPSLKNLMDS